MSKSAPTPDYTAAAQQQGQNNIQSALLGTQLGRPNQITPWGSQTWTTGSQAPAGGTGTSTVSQGMPSYDPTTGTMIGGGYGLGGTGGAGAAYGFGGNTGQGNYTGYGDPNQYTSTITLAPAQQALLDKQNAMSLNMGDTGLSLLSGVDAAAGKPIDYSALPALSGAPQSGQINTSIAGAGNVAGPQDFGAYKDQAYNDIMGRQNKQFDRQEASLQQQLANQGLTPGSEAYNRAHDELNMARTDAGQQADLASNQLAQSWIQQQNAAQAQKFGQNAQQAAFGNQGAAQQFAQGLAGAQFGNQARQQGIQEGAYQQSQPLDLLNAFRTGSQVQAPQFSQYANTNVTPAPIMQGAIAQGQANQASQNNLLSGLFGLGSAALGNWSGIFGA